MNVFHAIILGIVEGLTEFIPVSSTAHLKIVPTLLGWGDPGASFSAIIQIGPIVAVLIYFRRDLINLITAWLSGLRSAEKRRTVDYRMAWYVIAATIPIGLLGLVFKDQIEGVLRSLWITAVVLIVVGLVLLVAERAGTETKDAERTSWTDIVVISLAQCLSLIPGVSRSGATISAGLFRNLDRVTATRFSFLLSIPAITAAGLFQLAQEIGNNNVHWGPTIIGTVVAFIVGYAAIAWFLRYVSTHTFRPFVVYRIALGLLLMVLLATGVIDA